MAGIHFCHMQGSLFFVHQFRELSSLFFNVFLVHPTKLQLLGIYQLIFDSS